LKGKTQQGAGHSLADGGPQARRRSWLPYLIAVALAQLTLLLHLIPRDPAFSAKLQEVKRPLYRAQEARRLAALMRSDPRPGIRLIANGGSLLSKALRTVGGNNVPAAVLLIGPCSSCAGKDLLAWRQIAAQHPGRAVIILSRDTAEGVDAFIRTNRFPFPIISDPTGQMSRPFNPIWAPRAYGVTADGHLSWIQTNPEVDTDTIASCIWDGKRR